MTDTLIHRGPDGEGFFVEGPVGIGHRRLSIIDLTPAGHQPMTTRRRILRPSATTARSYNFRELRVGLEALGHRFRSRTDTEVVLEAYAEWGTAALPRFNGMFAFALWDPRTARAVCSPATASGSSRCTCAADGEHVTLRLRDQGDPRASRLPAPSSTDDALLEYFTFQNFLRRPDAVRERHAAAGRLHAHASRSAAGRADVLKRYWDFAFDEPDAPGDDREYREELDRLFRQAVSRQLVTDVHVGSYLSRRDGHRARSLRSPRASSPI